MKIKLIQMVILMFLVMSVVFLAQTQNGYGGPIVDAQGKPIVHDPGTHDPEFYIDACGYRKVSGTGEPRDRYFNAPICGTDGDEYVSEKGWYYRGSGELSGTHNINPKNPKQPSEQVYRLNLVGEASANASNASGKLSPTMDFTDALPREFDSWGGTGHIHLTITELPFHRVLSRSPCCADTASKHEWKPTEDAEMAVNVHPTETIETKTSKVYAEGQYEGNGSFSGTFGGSYSNSWSEKQSGHLIGISYGIEAEIGYGWWGTYWNPEIRLQEKEAIVNGNIDSYAAVDMTANYDQAENTLCPNDHYPISIPHLGQ